MLSFVAENVGSVLSVLVAVNIVLIVFLFQALSKIDTIEEDVAKVNTFITVDLAEAYDKDMNNIDTQSRKMFVTLWEYFFVMLSVRGVIQVNPETFITDGLEDIGKKYPQALEFIKIPKIDQEAVYKNWKNHYQLFANYAKTTPEPQTTPEEIFRKYHPDKEIL